MWELDHKENWVPKNWCFRTVVLENTLESPLDSKEFTPVHPKGNQSWIFFGRTDAEAEMAILWPPDGKNRLIGKDPDAGKGWRKEEKGVIWWDGRMPSLTQWAWVWTNSGRWWRTGEPGMLRSMGSQRVRHERVNWTEMNQTLPFLHLPNSSSALYMPNLQISSKTTLEYSDIIWCPAEWDISLSNRIHLPLKSIRIRVCFWSSPFPPFTL